MRYNKTIFAAVAAVLVFSCFSSGAKAAESSNGDLRMIPVIVNGQKVKFPDTEPFINKDGRTMVPVRFISEKLGGTVAWDSDTHIVTIQSGSKEITLPIGSKAVKVDGKEISLDTSAALEEGRTVVPLRFVSEVLDSTVEWDDAAHAVKITDAAYAAKVAQGEISLDAWGRELSKTWDPDWIRLSDLPQEFYDIPTLSSLALSESNRSMFHSSNPWTIEDLNATANRIKKYYAVVLNVDYRTIDEDAFIKGILETMPDTRKSSIDLFTHVGKLYVAWAKENHIITKGYADPEISQIRSDGGYPVVRTHFKFMIISADDTSQTFIDNWDVSEKSESIFLKKNVWYDGYADVTTVTYVGTDPRQHIVISGGEHMFKKNRYFYNEITS